MLLVLDSVLEVSLAGHFKQAHRAFVGICLELVWSQGTSCFSTPSQQKLNGFHGHLL